VCETLVNDYKEKTELTLDKMLVTVISALRSYNFITTIENNRKGLKKIIEASSDIFEHQSLEKLGSGILGQLTSILQLQDDPAYQQASGLTASGIKGQSVVLAATGAFCQYIDRPILEVEAALMHTALQLAQTRSHGFYCEAGKCAWYFKSQTGSENFLYFEIAKELDENDHDLLELFFTNVSLAFDNLFLPKGIEDTQKEIIFHIAETMECRSAETGSHVRRVAEYAKLLALKYGLDEEEAEMLKLASTTHDLGKIGIPDAILNKPGSLTIEEYDTIKTHVYRGHDLLMNSSSPIIQAAALIVLLHHERWDGLGFPRDSRARESTSMVGLSGWLMSSMPCPIGECTMRPGPGTRSLPISGKSAANISIRNWWISSWKTRRSSKPSGRGTTSTVCSSPEGRQDGHN